MSKKIYFVAGEASGDTHGAALISAVRDLQPDLEFVGRGGPRMRAIAGSTFMDWSESSSVLGLWEVLKHYRYFRGELRAAVAQVAALTPDAVVLVDYPGFNLRLARALRAAIPQLKIIYYISPQVWAWNRRRIPQMARYLDLMLCIFPFEAELYNTSGLRTVFVGHPMLETLAERQTSEVRNPNLVGLFPGSRMREIAKILPIMFEAARELLARRPATRFEIAAASPALAEEITRLLQTSELREDVVRITTGEASATMQRVQAGIVASGTATLEAAYFRLPFVIVYRVAWPTYLAARLVVKVKHLGMPNVLAGREIVPEFIQHQADPQKIADAVVQLMNDGEPRKLMLAELESVVSGLSERGASQSAAAAVLEEIQTN